MNESAAHSVLFVKAIEERDPRYEVLRASDRQWASREAGLPQSTRNTGAKATGQPLPVAQQEFLFRRAELLRRQIEKQHPAATAAYEAVRWRRWIGILLMLGSFILGAALNELGTDRRISIISFPLLGMLIWNFAVYLTLAAWPVKSLIGRPPRGSPPNSLLRLTEWLARRGLRLDKNLAAGPSATLANGLRGFISDWLHAASPLLGVRIRRLLHVCAALLATGTVAGMYMRGITFEYLAGWESTFLDAADVHALLRLVLAPASAATGIAIPDATHIAALRWSSSEAYENAAPWIHLYATTALLFIVLPRLLLALAAAFRESSLRRDFPLPDGLVAYSQRLLSASSLHERAGAATIVPYSFHPSEKSRQNLQLFLRELLGPGIVCQFQPAIDYGGEEDYIGRIATGTGPAVVYLVALFNLASTPEEENHGYLLHHLKKLVTHSATAQHLLVLVDESGYRRRLAEPAGVDARLKERKITWQNFARAHGIEMVTLDLDAMNTNAGERQRELDAARPAIWPSGEASR